MRSTINATIVAVVLAAAVGSPAVAIAATGTAPSIIAMEQNAKGGEVSITYAYLPKDGFLVVHPSDKRGKMSSVVLGQRKLSAGDHRNVNVKLSGTVKSGEKLWAELQQKPFASGTKRPFEDHGMPIEESFLIR
jgi:hypothetical protein